MYEIKNGRWYIQAPKTDGPDTLALGDNRFRVTVDRRETELILTPDEIEPFDLDRSFRGTTLVDRLITGSERMPDGCILWTKGKNQYGYGSLRLPSRDGRNVFVGTHRLSWVVSGGLLPKGLQLNHRCHSDSDCADGPTCRHRACINPAHLELVTGSFNKSRLLSARWAA